MMKSKKFHFGSKTVFLLLGVTILVAGFFVYQSYSEKQLIKEDATSDFEETIPQKCENGAWIEFPDLENSGRLEKFAGNEKLKYDKEKEFLSSADGTRIFSTHEDYSLFFFMDRDTRIEGFKLEGNKIYVKKIKCTGVESDANVLQVRRKVMNYIKENINSLALEKAPKNDWEVRVFYFVNDADLYVQYESAGSFAEEAPYDSRLWLIRISKAERNIPLLETLAYIHEDAEDPEKNIVKRGKDLYADAKNLTIYEFEDEANQWVLQ